MSPLDLLLRTVGVPGGVAAGVAAAASLVAGRRGGDPLRRAGAALALGLGAGAGLLAAGVRPSLPLAAGDSAWEWVLWFALAGPVLGVVAEGVRAPEPLRVLARGALGFGAGWLLLSPLAPHALSTGEVAGRAAAVGGAVAVLGTGLLRLAARRPLATAVPPVLVALVGTAVLLLEAGRSATMAAAAGVLAAAVAGAAGAGLLPRGSPFPPSAVPGVVLPFAGLLAAAHGYLNYGALVRWPLPTALLLAAAALAGLLVPPGLGERRPGLAAVAAAALAVAGVAAAAWTAPWGT